MSESVTAKQVRASAVLETLDNREGLCTMSLKGTIFIRDSKAIQRGYGCFPAYNKACSIQPIPAIFIDQQINEVVKLLLSGSFLIKFSSLSALPKIEELTAGSEEKTQPFFGFVGLEPSGT